MVIFMAQFVGSPQALKKKPGILVDGYK